jgi:hypothetical protein
MEKKLGWDNLIHLRSNIFFLGIPNPNETYNHANDFPFVVAPPADINAPVNNN